jgi:hypothetical protein
VPRARTPSPAARCRPSNDEVLPESAPCLYPGLVMVLIWLPGEMHRRLSEGVPAWSRSRKLLNEATEMHYAAGVRRLSCDLADALALLRVAERVYPESAPLIRIAIRKAGQGTSSPMMTDLPGHAGELYPEPERLPLLASVHVLVFGFSVLQFLDRMRELFRRVL